MQACSFISGKLLPFMTLCVKYPLDIPARSDPIDVVWGDPIDIRSLWNLIQVSSLIQIRFQAENSGIAYWNPDTLEFWVLGAQWKTSIIFYRGKVLEQQFKTWIAFLILLILRCSVFHNVVSHYLRMNIKHH